ncbi:anaerobic carbon-monoxide dehydrogenase catalytic subunit [Desulfallas sp. Bu1-1]|uniref:anaerobic carbon-monoxide dehydrogenase catalytic subunit n=1 Tax=Desulfallas sp. Bu1-1 TaxID=2787620 RepID=UPI00189F3F1D|nr:anaerobic carbon-monoxide dehydrogenase catalytic subunit [Desulfallas sp. Bu1-1]MBF7081802.1 anaerobic carbon-monoxide dehydrogenase catalytic subunit [Desulfallas sp. Bu1-1]
MPDKSVDQSTIKMIKKAKSDGVETVWDRLAAQEPQCGFGQLGICCRNCNMGPCRIDPFGDGPPRGVCGADADTIVARNLVRAIAAGAAAHSDHGRGIASTLLASARGDAPDYPVKDEAKLKALAGEFGIATDGRSVSEIALDLAGQVLEEFGTLKGSLQFINRVPGKRRALWDELGITPRGIDREVVESMHRTNIGVDNDYVNLILQGMRTALSDGWGGSTVATELSDVLFGTPKPVKGSCNLGVLKEDHVNIILHGHEPTLSDIIVHAARDPGLLQEARERGAVGINVCGMCCTGNEILMRHGVPVAGNFLQQELAIVTGAVEAMIVDIQCIMPSLAQVAKCYHTKIISTSPKAKFPGAEHVPFDEHNAMDVAKKIVRVAVENYSNRMVSKINIPSDQMEYMAGFSVEAILEALGGSLNPLIDAVKSGAIKGIVGVVGCNNPKYKQDYSHLTFVRELIKNDILVVGTGCAAIACAKDGLLLPTAAREAGDGLRGVCRSLNIPPVLHMGSCVDISRILTVAAAIANALGVDISDLPLAGAAPEWMSEKAVSIGTYVVSSGIFTILGTVPPVLGSKNVAELLTSGAERVVGAVFAVEEDPVAAAKLAVQHIAAKRNSLGLDE